VLQEITGGLDRCRIDKRRKHPNTFQLLLDPTLQQTDFLVSSAHELRNEVIEELIQT
jgi:hypothetical protein